MSEKQNADVAKEQAFKSLGSFVALPLVALICLLLGWFFFKDEVGAFFEFTAKVEDHENKIAKLENSNVDENEFIKSTEARLLLLEDFRGDITDELERRRVQIDSNTNWRDEQEKRATGRIKDQEFREKRLLYVEGFIEIHRFNIQKFSETQCKP